MVSAQAEGQFTDAVIQSWQQNGLGHPDAALIDPSYHRSMMRALPIIAAFSLFESYVEDFVKGVMKMDRHILDDNRILKMRVRVEDLLAPEEEKLDKVFRAMNEATGRGPGVARYEELLKFVGLSGNAPPDVIQDHFHKAQSVRHVWAHNAGIADADFIRRAAHLGFNKGDVVALTSEQTLEYVMSTSTYGMLIANRHRQQCGLDPIPVGGQGSISPVVDAFRAYYN